MTRSPASARAPGARPAWPAGRLLIILPAAAVLVVAIALLTWLWADKPSDNAHEAQGSLAPAGAMVTPTPMPIQPSAEYWEELLPRLEQAADAAPNDVNAQRKLALAFYNLGRFDEAVAIYEQLLAIEEDAVLRDRLGNTLRDMGNASGAESAYRKAIADDPTLAPPYLNLAELLWRQGRDDEALAIIDEGLDAVPEKSRSALEEGRKVLEEGDQ